MRSQAIQARGPVLLLAAMLAACDAGDEATGGASSEQSTSVQSGASSSAKAAGATTKAAASSVSANTANTATTASGPASGNVTASSGGSGGGQVCYTTTFPADENPLSEGGAWARNGDDTTDVRTETLGGVHVAHGTQVGAVGDYRDSSAGLPACATPTHAIEGIIWKADAQTGSGNREVELHLRWSDTNPVHHEFYGDTTVYGYEINTNQNGDYLILGRFREESALASVHGAFVPATGDVFKAQYTDLGDGTGQIDVWWNGVLQISYHDVTPPPGMGGAGIGFYVDAGVPNDEFGFSSVTATTF